MPHIAIIGNGIAGITAARFIRKLSASLPEHQISVISSESEFFFSRTALMYVYMGHMRWKDIQPYETGFWEKNRINLIYNTVQEIDFKEKRLKFNQDPPLSYDKLILATGSKSNTFDLPGLHLSGVTGLYSKQDLERIESLSPKIKKAVITGGGLIGIELAEMFHSRNIPVTMLVRETDYWSSVLPPEEAKMISGHIREHHIDLKLETQLKSITDDGQGSVAGIINDRNEEIACEFVGLTIGVRPNIDFLRSGPLECDKGILVNEYLETNIPDVYAIGDCAQIRTPNSGRKNIEAVWYTGRIMGETVAHTLCRRKTMYNPGIWYNSAKFFDIEYQVYGLVPAQIKSPLNSFYWEDPNGKKSVRLIYDDESRIIKGFNLMGIRFRHEVCERWIQLETKLDEVIANIRLAFFDPEFFKDIAPELIQQYNREQGKHIVLRSTNSLNAVLQFFKQSKSNT